MQETIEQNLFLPAYSTPVKKMSMGSSCMSKSPNSESTDDNSFERVSEPNDDLFESLISYFDHCVLTPIQFDNSITQSCSQLNDIRQIFYQQQPCYFVPQYYIIPQYYVQGYVDLTINESRILQDERTSLMIKNLPKDITQAKLKQELDANYRGQYDYLYIPCEQNSNKNQGYAFVNFMSSALVQKFYKQYNGQQWVTFQSDKVNQLK